MAHKPLRLGVHWLLGVLMAALAIVAAGIDNLGAAQEQPIKRTELMRFDVAGATGKETVVYVADVAPGARAGKHTHYGDELVYVLEGSLIVEPEGKEPITLKQGETAHLTQDIVHAARNGSDSLPAKVLVFLVVEKGKPLAQPR